MATADAVKENEFYVFENDTIKLTYAFWHGHGVMSFTVYNKLDIPIYIDWKKSSFIYNSTKLNYWVDEEHSRAVAFYGTRFFKGPLNVPYKEISLATGVINSSKVKMERVTFVPPQSNYSRTQFYLLKTGKDYELDVSCDEQVVPCNGNPKKETSLYTESFDIESTPVQIRNYLAISTTESFEKEAFVDNEFYLARVLEMDYKHFKYEDKATGKVIKPFKKKTNFYKYVDEEFTVEYRKRNDKLSQ
ncbi:MAG: hypothetical protein ACI9YU_000619 [Flavobacteriales bacterium]|jgi:hypothetical protein